MNAATALDRAAKGIRCKLNEFTSSNLTISATVFIASIADALADGENQDNDEDGAVTGKELIRDAAERRIADLFPKTHHRELCMTEAYCPVGCMHVPRLLVICDAGVHEYLFEKMQALAAAGYPDGGHREDGPPPGQRGRGGTSIVVPADDEAPGAGPDDVADDPPRPGNRGALRRPAASVDDESLPPPDADDDE